jgi:hypothetical protein
MKEYSQLQEFISVLMIFILMTCLSGCTSTKIISRSDLPLPDSSRYSRYPYVVHSEKSKFLLEKSTISDGILSGTINQKDKSYHAKEKIHLYLSSDSLIKIDKGEFLSVPMDEITKVTLKNPSAVKTILLITYCVAGLVVGVLFLYYIGYVFYLLITTPA